MAATDREPSPGYALAAEVLGQLAPDELPDLPELWAERPAKPVEPDNDSREDRILGSGLADALVEWGPLVVAFVGTEVVGGAAVDAAKDGLRDASGKTVHRLVAWRRRHRTMSAGAPIPAYTPEQISEIGRAAERAAVALGYPPADAKTFGDLVVGGLLRRRPHR